ncbi:hypothetical protein F5880DRAFT_1507901 [Lentinula raphanica]|nr:hypothetical protein F5880DRAFT_1507901 [Lentinula raphanica]
MARTMICDANNRPVFRKPRKDPKTGKTTPATRKAWLESQPMIVESSLTEHSVICKTCRDLVQLHPRYLYQVENWQKHIRSECTGRAHEEGDSEPPAPKRRRLTRSSEPVAPRTQMTLRSTRKTVRRVEADRRLEQENFDDDETDVENIEELKHDDHDMAVAQCLTRQSENQFRTPLVESQGSRQTLNVSDSTRMNLVVAAQVWTGISVTVPSVGFHPRQDSEEYSPSMNIENGCDSSFYSCFASRFPVIHGLAGAWPTRDQVTMMVNFDDGHITTAGTTSYSEFSYYHPSSFSLTSTSRPDLATEPTIKSSEEYSVVEYDSDHRSKEGRR